MKVKRFLYKHTILCLLLVILTGVSGIAAMITIVRIGLINCSYAGVFIPKEFVYYMWLIIAIANITILGMNKIAQINFPEDKFTWGIPVNIITGIIYTILQFL